MSWQYWGQPVPRAWAARHKPVLARPPAITQPVPQSTAAHNAHVAKTQHHSLCAHFLVLCEIGSTVNRLDWGNRPDPLRQILFYRGVAIEATMNITCTWIEMCSFYRVGFLLYKASLFLKKCHWLESTCFCRKKIDHIPLLIIDFNHTLSRFWTG